MKDLQESDINLDPVTAEVLRGSFVAIVGEMKSNLMRTAYNQIIYEAQDFTVGIFDADGDTISVGLGLPMFMGGLSRAVKAKIAHYGLDGLEPGDVLLTNDAYIMGSHLNHMICTMPVFVDGQVVAFVSSMAHWLDVGGVIGGTTTDIYSEGIQLPIVKIYKAGVADDELLRLITLNVRFPDAALGDLRAQVAAARTGESRMGDLTRRYGQDTVRAAVAQMFSASEAQARAAVAQIADGVYSAHAAMDDDGVTGAAVPLTVRVVVEGDQMTVDLTEVGAEVSGYFNSGEAAGISAAQVAFKSLTSPQDPINEGTLRAVAVTLPPGSVLSAQRPRAMRWWMTYPMTVIDCVFKALAPALPTGTIAGHHADLAITTVIGADPSTGRMTMLMPGPQGGGWGATRDKDGENATICINDGDTHNVPIEIVESRNPGVLAVTYALRQDSGGPGRRRGGLGTRQEWVLAASGRLNSFIERTRHAPWGMEGGGDALPNRVSLIRSDGTSPSFTNGKLDLEPVAAGDRLVVETGGGGGYGPAIERPLADVLADVEDGLVSHEHARAAYRVDVSRDSSSGELRGVRAPADRLNDGWRESDR